MEWEPHHFLHLVQDKLKGDELTDIDIKWSDQETKVTDELIDILANLKMPSEGLRSINFFDWRGGMEEALNSAAIERLV